MYSWHDIVGNIGVFIVLLTYLFLQLGRIDPRSASYSFWNIIGSLMIVISLSQHFNLSAFIIEVAWVAISIFGLCRALYRPISSLESQR